MTDYVHSETELLHKLTPNVPITTNLMEYFPGLDYHYLQKELDFVCWDSYPTGAARPQHHDDLCHDRV